MSGLRLLTTTKTLETERSFRRHHLPRGPEQVFEEELLPRDEAGKGGEMDVEEEVVGDIMKSALIPSFC